MRESKIEAALVWRIRRLKGECIKVGTEGWPDRVVILPGGETFWIELKSEVGKLKPHQVRRFNRLLELEHEVLMLNSIAAIHKQFPMRP